MNGTPADCVSLGAYQWGKVDLVLSGLNIGLNLGNSIWHSGTVAAARQAALLGICGIALSAPAGAEPDFVPYKPWVRRVLDTLLAETSLSLVNVNLPTAGLEFQVPFGGNKESGVGGREQGPAALDFYSSWKTVSIMPL